jgi:hypothetical protein
MIDSRWNILVSLLSWWASKWIHNFSSVWINNCGLWRRLLLSYWRWNLLLYDWRLLCWLYRLQDFFRSYRRNHLLNYINRGWRRRLFDFLNDWSRRFMNSLNWFRRQRGLPLHDWWSLDSLSRRSLVSDTSTAWKSIFLFLWHCTKLFYSSLLKKL